MKIDKSKMLDDRGRPLTQSLFLEAKYDTDFAIYTLKEDDYEFNGKFYPSLKKLYLEEEDVTEYIFARKYLFSWKHWKRLSENKLLTPHIELWREELELKLRAQAVKSILDYAASENGGFQAAKWLANRGWLDRGAGRPSKEEVERHKRVEERISEEFGADIARLADYKEG